MMGSFSLALLGTMAGAQAPEPPSNARPNVLFVYADDLRADAIGPYGNREIRTPNLDRLASRGAVLERAYVMGGHHGAICIASRAMMLTGRSLFRAKESLADQTTWPRQLASSGYQTFATGKWHNGREAFVDSFDNGGTVFFGGMSDPDSTDVVDCADGKFGKVRKAGSHLSEAIADEAVAFLGRAEADRPFACYVAFTAPHDPRKAPARYHEQSNARPISVPPNFLPEHPFDNGELKVRDEMLAGFPRGLEEVRGHWRDYRAIIEHLDDQLGRIFEALENTGRASNTVVVFAGDNGLALGSHGLMGKQSLYEHSARVPVILAGPGVPSGFRTPALSSLFDLAPTLFDLLGLPTPFGVEGLPLGPVLRGHSAGRESLLLAYRDIQQAVVENRWKLIVYPKVGIEQLFDIGGDPLERHDLAADPAHSGTLERLRASLRTLGAEYGAPRIGAGNAPARRSKPGRQR